MIEKAEIKAKAEEFGIHESNVQRDYVFGWLLAGIYLASELRNLLILKGGNCFRKAYFPLTRFSLVTPIFPASLRLTETCCCANSTRCATLPKSSRVSCSLRAQQG